MTLCACDSTAFETFSGRCVTKACRASERTRQSSAVAARATKHTHTYLSLYLSTHTHTHISLSLSRERARAGACLFFLSFFLFQPERVRVRTAARAGARVGAHPPALSSVWKMAPSVSAVSGPSWTLDTLQRLNQFQNPTESSTVTATETAAARAAVAPRTRTSACFVKPHTIRDLRFFVTKSFFLGRTNTREKKDISRSISERRRALA